MKILSIRGKNLASLEKEFEVDFASEPLHSAGIFAITGSTGSGKSTLLDALCLALFDASPRASNASENIPMRDVGDKTINQRDCRNILRRGAAEGFAETEFVALDGNVYRARWSVRRARNRADGSMQNSEIRLYNCSDGKEEQGVKTELLARIAQLLGLNFEQFMRSVLLAQGDFATFLKARQSEKAELLEKLTGSDVYSRISVAIYEKTKRAEAEWNALRERIKGIELLPVEQIAALEAEKQLLQQELSALKKTTETLASQLKWTADDQRLQTAVDQAERHLSDAKKAIADAEGRYDYIRRIDVAQGIRDDFGMLENAAKQLAEYQRNLQTHVERCNETEKQLAEAEKQLAGCEQEQAALTQKYQELAPQIIKARELDVRIKELSALEQEAQKEYDAAKNALDEVEKNSQALQAAMQKNAVAVSELDQWFEANKNYESIVPRTELIVNLTIDAQTAYEQKEQNGRLLLANQAQLDENLRQLSVANSQLSTQSSPTLAQIAAMRANLVEGTPCPVCGSRNHPVNAGKLNFPTSPTDLSDTEANQIDPQLVETLTGEIDRRKNEIARLAALTESYAEQYDKARRHLAQLLAPLPELQRRLSENPTQAEYAELNGYIKAQTEKWYFNIEILNRKKNETEILQTQIIVGKNTKQASIEICDQKHGRLMEAKRAKEVCVGNRRSQIMGKSAEAAEKYFAEKQEQLRDKLKEATVRKNACAEQFAALNGVIGQIRHNVAQVDERRVELQTTVERWIANTTQSGVSTVGQLAELLTKDHAWIQAEKQALKLLAETQTAAAATLDERRRNIEAHRSSEYKPADASITPDVLQKKLVEKNVLTDEKNKRLHAIALALSTNEQAQRQAAELEKNLADMNATTENLRKLNSLLGSANGNKFKEIAQGYTLDVLLVHANKHLDELAPRYRLQRIVDTLALQVVDADMLDEVRTIHSLSGGESFLVALALALGLSSLSSNKMSVESLFIDEGFGSLDSETLRTAMEALERIRAQGRKIGVISHIAEVTERIAVRINVVKTANGQSVVSTTGL